MSHSPDLIYLTFPSLTYRSPAIDRVSVVMTLMAYAVLFVAITAQAYKCSLLAKSVVVTPALGY